MYAEPVGYAYQCCPKDIVVNFKLLEHSLLVTFLAILEGLERFIAVGCFLQGQLGKMELIGSYCSISVEPGGCSRKQIVVLTDACFSCLECYLCQTREIARFVVACTLTEH